MAAGLSGWLGRSGVVLVVVVAAWWALTEPGPEPPQLPRPDHVGSYTRYQWWERGRALRWAATPRPDPSGPIAVDEWHSRRQGVDLRLVPGETNYWKMHGFARAFSSVGSVRRLGWRWHLDGASAVFLNLPTGDGPGFRWSEVRALVSFVRAGGGLLLITDHTNCYLHADMLAQLAHELGFSLPPVTAADPARGLGPRAKAWIRVTDFASHPVTEGVRAVGMTTAGAVDGLTPLARTGPTSWRDAWDPARDDGNMGYTGDLDRQPEEPLGPVPVVAAGEVGKGRVVVVTDQNAFGATMIGYGDNARLFDNAIAWVSGRRVARAAPRVQTLGAGCADLGAFGFRTLQVRLAAVTTESCGATSLLPAEAFLALPGTTPPPAAPSVIVEAGGASTTPPLRWEGFRAVDAAGRVVVEEIGNRLFVHEGDLLRNANLGEERDPPPPEGVEAKVVEFLTAGG